MWNEYVGGLNHTLSVVYDAKPQYVVGVQLQHVQRRKVAPLLVGGMVGEVKVLEVCV